MTHNEFDIYTDLLNPIGLFLEESNIYISNVLGKYKEVSWTYKIPPK